MRLWFAIEAIPSSAYLLPLAPRAQSRWGGISDRCYGGRYEDSHVCFLLANVVSFSLQGVARNLTAPFDKVQGIGSLSCLYMACFKHCLLSMCFCSTCFSIATKATMVVAAQLWSRLCCILYSHQGTTAFIGMHHDCPGGLTVLVAWCTGGSSTKVEHQTIARLCTKHKAT